MNNNESNLLKGSERARATFPAIEAVMTKKQKPFPLLDLKVCDVDFRLPVSDETLCQAFALILGQRFPVYR